MQLGLIEKQLPEDRSVVCYPAWEGELKVIKASIMASHHGYFSFPLCSDIVESFLDTMHKTG